MNSIFLTILISFFVNSRSSVVTPASMADHVATSPSEYHIGVGIADITGPAAGINLMGYAKLGQNSAGIHIRTRSRAFAFYHAETKKRLVYVVSDVAMQSQLIRQRVLNRLAQLYPGLYTRENVALSGTHTHSAPGGYLQYLLYHATSLGMVWDSVKAIEDGIVRAIQRAHDDLRPSRATLAIGELLGANINRSPTAYENNPAEERAKYAHDVDKNMTLVRIDDVDGVARGAINWFAVHPTSMNNTNRLISGDNKGYAAYLMERRHNAPESRSGLPGGFVAAFAQSNMGDVSPNTLGARCVDTGLPCDRFRSTCGGKNEKCIARGPGWEVDIYETTRRNGKLQYEKAEELLQHAASGMVLKGGLDYRHVYVDFSDVTVMYNATVSGKTCLPAMGVSFAAGTTDGPGAFDFRQGDSNHSTASPIWNAMRNLITQKPSAAQKACHGAKPILFNTGEATFPYQWQPTIVELQLLRIGQLVVIVVPAEFTTMSGRRIRDHIRSVLTENGVIGDDGVVVLSGPSNTYSSYVATYEEYQVQRYEGASTIFGPHTLGAYIQEFGKLALSMAAGTPLPGGPTPPDLSKDAFSFQPDVILDAVPPLVSFGDVHARLRKNKFKPGETVSVSFWSGHPRNNLQTESTFLSVERRLNGTWVRVRDDGDWSTRFHWKRTPNIPISPSSIATTEWVIEDDTVEGVYQMVYRGYHKDLLGVHKHVGFSGEFRVVKS